MLAPENQCSLDEKHPVLRVGDAEGARNFFVAFKETSRKMLANASSFQWPWAEWELVDAVPPFNAITIGEFEFEGILAVLAARVRRFFHWPNAKSSVFYGVPIFCEPSILGNK
jgi:hypothetical protein